MKLCTKCDEERPYDLFSKNKKNKDGFFSWCKPCMAAYEKERYHNGDRVRKERNRNNFGLKNKRFIWIYLTENPCVDCGNTDPRVLEFDHRDGVDKKFNISESFQKYSTDTIKKEIDKCDVRCANCHRIRTIKQFDTWRNTFEL